MALPFWAELLVYVLYAVFALTLAIVTFVRTGSIAKSTKLFKELFMKYDTIDSKKKTKFKGQEFTEYIVDYILDNQTNELSPLPNKKNIQAEIQSHLECALERALEKFLPNVVSETSDPAEEYQHSSADLAVLGESMELAEYYREKLGLSDNASVSDIYAALDKHSVALKSKINDVTSKLKSKKEETNTNEKKESL